MSTDREDLRERLAALPQIVPPESILELKVTLARIEERLAGTLAQADRITSLETESHSQALTIARMETFQSIILWVVNGGWGVLVTAAFILTKIGVL